MLALGTLLLGLICGWLIPRDAFPWMRRISAWLMRERCNRRLAWQVVAAALLVFVLMLALSGCAYLPRTPQIKVGDTQVVAPRDAGKPATLATAQAQQALVIPTGSRVIVTETAAQPATANAPAQPATTITEVVPAAPMKWEKQQSSVDAATGTIDTTVAAKRIDSQEARPLLYAAMACLVAAGFFVWRAYPTPALCCAGAAVVFFIAWKVSDLPPWFWAVGLAALVGGAALYLGHERGEKARQ
jgi:hypothetical protein